MSNFKKIRGFIKKAEIKGYEVSISNFNNASRTSCYIDFCKSGTGIIDFKIRISDHNLGSMNQIPSGVIYCNVTLNNCLEKIDNIINEYTMMDEEDINELWTNRTLI